MKLRINHQLLYQYSSVVSLQAHRLYLLPRLGPYLKINKSVFTIFPKPSSIAENLDVEGNSQYVLFFDKSPTDQLTINTEIEVENLLENPFKFVIYPFDSQRIPFSYTPQVQQLVQPYLVKTGITDNIRQFANQVANEVNWETHRFFTHLNTVIHRFGYQIREEGEPFLPEMVLVNKMGSCRDYVNLYMAVCRSLGIAARFVSGYFCGSGNEPQYLHAWAEVYVPGAGWRGYDPTQNSMAADRHIPLAASAIPQRVTPVFGTFRGSAIAQLITKVNVLTIE